MTVKGLDLPGTYEVQCLNEKCYRIFWTMISFRPLWCAHCESKQLYIFNRETGTVEVQQR